MLYGLYLSAQGARAQSTRLDAVANNLANAGTTAFKRALSVFQHHLPFDVANGYSHDVPGNLNESTGGVTTADVVTDYGQGAFQETGNRLDVALAGPGFFQVADGSNRRFLTRNGNFSVNAAGELVTAGTGHKVLSDEGAPITVSTEGGEITIGSDGAVQQRNGGAVAELGRLAVVAPPDPAELEKLGDSLYAHDGPLVPVGGGVQVKSGFLEASGTNAVSEMTEMIQASRAFETNVNMIRYQDESLARLLQSIPRR